MKIIPEKFDAVRDAIIFEEVEKGLMILQGLVNDGTIYDYAMAESVQTDYAVKFREGEDFWLMMGKNG
jgi:hypothetical protein